MVPICLHSYTYFHVFSGTREVQLRVQILPPHVTRLPMRDSILMITRAMVRRQWPNEPPPLLRHAYRSAGKVLKTGKKNPNVDTSFLPDREREREMTEQRERLKKEWLETQEKMKSELRSGGLCN